MDVPFIQMFRDFQSELLITDSQIVTDGMNALKDHHYSKLAGLLSNLENAGTDATRKSFANLKQKLHKPILLVL